MQTSMVRNFRPSMRMVLFGVLLFVLLITLMTFQTSKGNQAPLLLSGNAVERSTLSSDGFLANSKFSVTKASRAYEVNPKPKCWVRHCEKPNNHWAFESCDEVSSVATEWNSLGARTMERFVASSGEKLEGLATQWLHDAEGQFTKATEAAGGKCWAPLLNLAIVKMKLRAHDDAASSYQKALDLSTTNEKKAIVYLHMGLNEELKGSGKQHSMYDKVRTTDEQVEQDYWGIATTQSSRKQLSSYGPAQTPPAMLDYALYKHFAAVSIAKFSLLPPGTQDAFIENRYAVLRHVLPPFVLSAAQKCFRDMIDSGQLKYGDGQSDRYVTYNDRCARFLQYQLADLIRTVIAHNAIPSYTYFGGYKGGSQLKPHTDRAQCEFTLSLNIQQYPADKPWTLSAGKTALFDKDPNWRGRNPERLPDEADTVNADLYSGDGLIFMGRHLVHFRRGTLPEGHWTNQIFVHFVPEDFTGELA